MRHSTCTALGNALLWATAVAGAEAAPEATNAPGVPEATAAPRAEPPTPPAQPLTPSATSLPPHGPPARSDAHLGNSTPPNDHPALPPPQSRIAEPPLPGSIRHGPATIWEPPPPPQPRHVAPKTSLWAGIRLGWFAPFGYLYAQSVEVAPGIYDYYRVSWRDYAGPGPLIELDLGVRLSRAYNVFALWEHGELAAGAASPEVFGNHGEQERGRTDFFGIGVRASSDANSLGFLSEVALGYRRAQSSWEDGTELELSSGILEARLGIGADIRISQFFSLSPLLTFGFGTFSEVNLIDSDGRKQDQIARQDEYDGHGWLTVQLGAHFDLLRGK